MKVPEGKKAYTSLLKQVGVPQDLATQAAEIRARGGSKTLQERQVMNQLARVLAGIVEDEINSSQDQSPLRSWELPRC